MRILILFNIKKRYKSLCFSKVEVKNEKDEFNSNYDGNFIN